MICDVRTVSAKVRVVVRQLTAEESAHLDRRRSEFDRFLAERLPLLTDFMRVLELPEAPLVLVEAERFLTPLDTWVSNQDISPGDEGWLVTRLGYFAGEYLVQRLSGCWFLDEIPDSRYFARYVVGRFALAVSPHAMVDPFAIAGDCITKARSLNTALTDVENELRARH
jgi:hypothetical protein